MHVARFIQFYMLHLLLKQTLHFVESLKLYIKFHLQIEVDPSTWNMIQHRNIDTAQCT